MGKKFSEKNTHSPSPSKLPRNRDPIVFFVASQRSYLQAVLTECIDVPDRYTAFTTVEELSEGLSALERVNVAFAVLVEESGETVDVPALRSCKLEYPQISYLLMLDKCDQASHLRFQSLGVQNIMMSPFNTVNLKSEIATALPNIPQFKRHSDLMKRGMVRLDFLIPSDLSYVLGLNYMISMLLKEFAFPPTDCRINVPLACDEALTNAIVHGNDSDAEKKVSVHIYVSSSRFKMRIKDQGAGFDVNEVADPREGENMLRSGGRGVYLMRSIMDSVTYKEGGRLVELEKANTSSHAKLQGSRKG
jgi:serine/threonine-protein kinase RsbW